MACPNGGNTSLCAHLRKLCAEQERYRIALGTLADIMFEYDIRNDVFYSFEKSFDRGLPAAIRSERPCFRRVLCREGLLHPEDLERVMSILEGMRQPFGPSTPELPVELRITASHCSQELVPTASRFDSQNESAADWNWKSVQYHTLYDQEGHPSRLIGTIRDISEAKSKEHQLIEQTKTDPLTGLYNLNAVKKLAETYLTEREEGEPCALLIFDLDYFKRINDTLGHLFGNAVLTQVADALHSVCRSTDLVARIGGDEFLILLKNITAKNAIRKSEEILTVTRSLRPDRDVYIKLSCSIGIVSSHTGEGFDTLFVKADQALYAAKKNGRNGYAICYL